MLMEEEEEEEGEICSPPLAQARVRFLLCRCQQQARKNLWPRLRPSLTPLNLLSRPRPSPSPIPLPLVLLSPFFLLPAL